MRKKALKLNSMLYFVVKESTVINLLNMSWWTHLLCLKVYSWLSSKISLNFKFDIFTIKHFMSCQNY